ncbi:alanine racemase [Chelativorans intermedius]|uniref:Alanine racemase n=1 Tax=Chelativorans intermedius TaxID=515947 RepID=A0ABV6D4P5_9HYPH|nr:alanine racemase [Chelativorans intermedius]MCT8998963.1 alanine racemase [Chelativorans intermedius]
MAAGGPGPHLAGGRLTIDLAALAWNYRFLAQRSAPAQAAAVVKADAYGLGLAPAARTLWQAGCRRFFVALPHEGLALRAVLPEAEIFVFNGLFGAEAAAAYRRGRLIPVLNGQSDLSVWEAHGWDAPDRPRPCALHVETGMNRLGMTGEELRALATENALTQALSPLLILSHLACADTPDHPMNRRQCESFQALRAVFPEIESSLANSAGIFLGGDFLCDLTRPGIALFGAMPVGGMENPLRPVVTAEARISQIKRLRAGETASYGAAPLARDTIVAVAAVGYADGYLRAASGSGVPLRKVVPGAAGFIHGKEAPVIGRVTMDLTLFDVTALGPDAVAVGDHIELFGPNMPIERVAEATGTIAYELLTAIGHRYHREYLGDGL